MNSYITIDTFRKVLQQESYSRMIHPVMKGVLYLSGRPLFWKDEFLIRWECCDYCNIDNFPTETQYGLICSFCGAFVDVPDQEFEICF